MDSIPLLRSIFGLTRPNIKPLACAIDRAVELMFVEHVSKDDILITKDIYPDVAREMSARNHRSMGRRIERLALRCWEELQKDEELMRKYIGKPLRDVGAPSDLIFYLAYYCYFDRSFYEVIEQNPALAF